MQKNVASQSIALFAFDSATGLAKSGDSANMVFYVAKDFGSVTAISASSGVPTEIDSTNAKGWYKIALSQAETNADALLFSGKSSTGGIGVIGTLIQTVPANFGAQSINSSGQMDVIKINGTSQTARDLGASVLLSSGTGTGQISLASGLVTVGTNNDKTGYTASTVSDKTGYALTAAGYNAAADALLARNVAGGSSAGRIVSWAMYQLVNKWTLASGTLTVYGTDDSTPAFTASVGTNSAALPIVSSDPA